MGIILRQGDSGPIFRGTSNADVLAWNALAQQWESATLTPGGTVAELTRVRFVDVGTSVPVEDQDGTIAAPFASMQAAFDSVGTANHVIVYAVPGDYSAQSLVPSLDLEIFEILSLGYVPRRGREFIESIQTIPLVRLPSIDASAKLYQAVLSGCVPSGIGLGDGLLLQGALIASGCNFSGVQLPQADVTCFGCVSIGGTIGQCYFEACYFNGCNISSPGGPITMVDTEFNSGGAASIIFDVDGNLFLDSYTCSQIFAATETLTNCRLVVRNRPLMATISVVVPAVAADAVGYVNVSTVGTVLEGIDVGQLVVANPTADLVAAGAGGGFINARISAVDTIRCAFNGALAGGAVDFVFGVFSPSAPFS